MRIDGPAQLRKAEGPKRTTRAGGNGAVFRLDEPDAPRTAASAGPANTVGDVTALLALQELPDATEGRSRGLKRGHELLDMLDQVRLALLLGRIPESRLKNLLHMVRQRAEGTVDPALRDILADIELRAAVELAKFQQA